MVITPLAACDQYFLHETCIIGFRLAVFKVISCSENRSNYHQKEDVYVYYAYRGKPSIRTVYGVEVLHL